ncbi:MAG: UDP-N-acetylmuramate dehydrogenase [Gammaproteobacteria bacterium]|nr:UDP-N-acetylmuramate dehydrogenase [Gammaproteobacteria bacterium]
MAMLANEPMSKHTTWRLGGPVDVFFRPKTLNELQEFVRDLDDSTPVYWTGLGSNLLVRDGGIRGVVIAPHKALGGVEKIDGHSVQAGAGVPCTILARRCAEWQLGPSAFFAGIPGTVGGALAMNAGAFGGETWDHITEVDVLDRKGEIKSRRPDDFDVSYRHVSGPANEWFIAARFKFIEQSEDSLAAVKALMRERQEKQPLGLPSCGSVFRNPPGQHAAALIETAGLKGYRIGGAQVSEKHANFIINTGDATAADVESLIAHVRRVVEKQHDVVLVPEVHIVGEAAA